LESWVSPSGEKGSIVFQRYSQENGGTPSRGNGLVLLPQMYYCLPEDTSYSQIRGMENNCSERRREHREKTDPRWKMARFPLYYTLLTLSEIDLPSAKAELRHARPIAGKLMKRYQKNDRTSRFRKMGLEEAMTGQKQEVV
jgi:hypothetical protein